MAHGAPGSVRDDADLDDAKQQAVLQSIAEANERQEQEGAQLMEALLRSKADMPATGVPLSGDGVVILRLTRKSRSPEVLAVLSQSHLLSHCHARVADAGCSVTPDWANGAHSLVPLTREQLEETDFELNHHHVVALEVDIEHIRAALRTIDCKTRPKVSLDHKACETGGACKRARGDDGTPWVRGCDLPLGSWSACSDRVSQDVVDEDAPVDMVVLKEFAPRTDSSVGFPDNPYIAEV